MNFLQDSLAKRMHAAQQAGQLYREQPFVLGIPANRLNPDFPSEEKVLIQGIIDAFFVEDGEIVLVDYKTDRVNTAKELWDRYETQLDHYEEALIKLMQMPVKERILYSFSLEKCVSDSQSEL
jgi:ATP-dependent helicase/nuclease subunit A